MAESGLEGVGSPVSISDFCTELLIRFFRVESSVSAALPAELVTSPVCAGSLSFFSTYLLPFLINKYIVVYGYIVI
jgi:hypothetical protein